MKQATATALVSVSSEYRNSSREQSAGPCPNEGCTGTLEIRHERQFGRVYTACPPCERRVLEVRQLREKVQRLAAELERLQQAPPPPKAPKPLSGRASAREARAKRRERDAEIGRRYIEGQCAREIAPDFGLSTHGVLDLLRRTGVPMRRPGPQRRAVEGGRV